MVWVLCSCFYKTAVESLNAEFACCTQDDVRTVTSTSLPRPPQMLTYFEDRKVPLEGRDRGRSAGPPALVSTVVGAAQRVYTLLAAADPQLHHHLLVTSLWPPSLQAHHCGWLPLACADARARSGSLRVPPYRRVRLGRAGRDANPRLRVTEPDQEIALNPI